MKQKLLSFIFTLLLFGATVQAQTKVWDFGNDSATWPLSTGIGSVATLGVPSIVVDKLGLIPNSTNINFGAVNASSANFSAFGETYTAVNRFQLNGGGGVNPLAGEYTPTQRSLYFDVDGPCTVKVFFKTGSNGAMRTLFLTDGASIVGSATTNDGSPAIADLDILNASYAGTGGRLYIFGDTSCNLYSVEVSGANVLSANDFKSLVSTNIKAVNDRIYVSNVKTSTQINIYSITGALVKSFKTNSDTDFKFNKGLWIATVKTEEGQKSVKLLTH